MRGFAIGKLKNSLAVPSHRPDVPGQQTKGRIRIFHLGTTRTSLEADTMQNCHDAFWRVFLGNVSIFVAIHVERNSLTRPPTWQYTKDHSGMSNPQLCSKTEGETGRCEAICYKQHSGADELEHVQKQSSNPGSPLSTDAHILACVRSTGP